MKSWIAGLTLLLAAAAPQAAPGTSAPAVSSLTAVYDFYIAGIRAAKMTISARFDADSYQATGDFKVRGLVSLFTDSDIRAEAAGKLAAGALLPAHYRSLEIGSTKERRIDIAFAGSKPFQIDVAPAFHDKPWAIDPLDQDGGVTDPLSAVLSALAPGPVSAVCGQHIEAFDGRRRFAFDIAAPKHTEDPKRTEDRIRCDGTFTRLSGYRPEQMANDRQRPFTLYLAERPAGDFQVVQLTTPTIVGEVVMQLRD